MTNKPGSRARIFLALWAGVLLVLFALHFVHLLADFPNNSPWTDYSKYTDEGWYSNAATRFFLTGHWYLHGDFNPAVALPVWPLLLAAVFRFTGVSMAAARALIVLIFGVNLLLSWYVLRAQAARWVALLAITLLVTSPFLFAFSRLAILEPLVVCLWLLSWLLALRLPRFAGRSATLLQIAIGVVLCLTVLAKTTGLFLVPSTLFLVANAYGWRRPAIRPLVTVCVSGLAPWCAWYFLLVRPHYRVDYFYLFEVNRWPQPIGFVEHILAYWWALNGALWISHVLCGTAIALLLLALIPHRRKAAAPHGTFWRNPLVGASLVALVGYIGFVGLQNHPQPRYYETVIYPLAFLLALGTAHLLDRLRALPLRIAGAAALAVLAGVCVAGTFRIAGYVRHPEYTWLNAARGVTAYIDAHPAPNRLVLSISGDDLSLMAHLPAICDDFGTFDLPYRVHVYQPSWYADWNDLDPGTEEDLETQYSLQQVASFPAFDDPDRDTFVLYRLIPLPPNRQKYSAAEESADNADK